MTDELMTDVRVRDILISGVRYRNARFEVRTFDGEHPSLRLHYPTVDSKTQEPRIAKSRWYLLSRHSTESEVVQTALAACIAMAEHEAREDFHYRGAACFGPHFDVNDLVALANRKGEAGARPDPSREKEPTILDTWVMCKCKVHGGILCRFDVLAGVRRCPICFTPAVRIGASPGDEFAS
jgi:hypothetical protein